MISPTIPQLLQNSSPAVAEQIFLLAIREHHQSLNLMSGQVLVKDTSPFLAQFATGVIADQRGEQVEFALYLKNFYGIQAPVPTGNIQAAVEIVTGPLSPTGSAPLPDTGGFFDPSQAGRTAGFLGGLAALMGVGVYALVRYGRQGEQKL